MVVIHHSKKDMASSSSTPLETSGSPVVKRTATSPPVLGSPLKLGGLRSYINPSKFFKTTNEGAEHDNFKSPLPSPHPSPEKDTIRAQIMHALASQEFADKIASVVAETVLTSMTCFEPKFDEYEEKFTNLLSSVEILHSEINTLKKGSPAASNTVLASMQADIEALKIESKKKDEYIETLNKRVEHLEAYSRRNAVRISNIPTTETPGNDVNWMIQFSKKHLNVDLNPNDIGRMHRTGPSSTTKPRDILVKFTSYLNRAKVFSKRTFLGSATNPERKADVFINEHLTKQRASLFFRARQGVKIRKISGTWTYDGSIITKQLPAKDAPTKMWQHMCDLVPYLEGLQILPKPVVVVPEPTVA